MTTTPTTADPTTAGSLWSPERRGLTLGLVLTITLVAFESLAVATVMPEVKDDLGGLSLYGWVFSAFFLASILGIVVAGQLADRRGLVLPFAAGLVIFCAGLVVGGLAPSMEVLIVGRVLQGIGAGAIPPTAYAAIGRGFPPELRPRMFATLSTAWVIPGLIGPAIATFVEHALSWRWVFLGLLPIVAIAGALALPALTALERRVGVAPSEDPFDKPRLLRVFLLIAGAAAVLGAGSASAVAVGVALAAVGLPLAIWAFAHLVPTGTLRLAPGVPATVAVRGLLTAAFFTADAYLPLTVVDGRGGPTWLGGLTLSAGALVWTVGSWAQARWIHRVGPRTLDRAGLIIIAVASLLMVGVAQGLPVALAPLVWAFGAFGMGMAYAPLSVTVLAAAAPGEEGAASAGLQLSDTLGIAAGTGLGGGLVALADGRGWSVADGVTTVFVLSVTLAVLGGLAAGRLPRRIPEQATAD